MCVVMYNASHVKNDGSRVVLRFGTEGLHPLPTSRSLRGLATANDSMRNLHMPLEQVLTNEALAQERRTDCADVRFEPRVAGQMPLALVLAQKAHTAEYEEKVVRNETGRTSYMGKLLAKSRIGTADAPRANRRAP